MKNGVRTIILLFGDILVLIAAFFIMLNIAFPGAFGEDVFGIWILVFFLFNLYEAHSIKPDIPHLRKVGIASLVALTGSTIMFYIVPSFGITPKTNLVIFSLVFVVLFIIWRRIFYKIFSVKFKKGVAFVAEPNQDNACISKIVQYIETYPQSGFFVLGIFSSMKEFAGKQNVKQVDTLIVSKQSLWGAEDLAFIFHKIDTVLDLTDAYENILGKIPVDSIDEAWFLHNVESEGKSLYDVIIRFLGMIVAVIILIALSPFMVIAAILIKLQDGGPILYTQMRVGKGDKVFKLYKFRSMIVGADKNGAEWTEKNDPRITAVGKIIRKLHIDEAPQLWNVLRGEMALVGPRPEIPSFENKLRKEIPHYGLRHIITPGFTGWAQIKFRNARGVAESKEKFEYDLYYIKNRDIFMDIGIILRTIQIIFTH